MPARFGIHFRFAFMLLIRGISLVGWMSACMGINGCIGGMEIDGHVGEVEDVQNLV
jgi:hypothetical protein